MTSITLVFTSLIKIASIENNDVYTERNKDEINKDVYTERFFK